MFLPDLFNKFQGAEYRKKRDFGVAVIKVEKGRLL